jgi:ribosomal protein S18 acetylase RimI-like enzyme
VTLKPNEDDAFDDGKVSRAFNYSITQQQQQILDSDDLAHAVVDYIRKNYYGSAQCMNNYPSYYEPETYFCALYNGRTVESTTQSLFADTNGIVGIVSAQLRKRAPLIAGPSINPNNNDSSETNNVHTPSVTLPIPHVYIANMKVDTKIQRRGIAMSLLCAVTEYTKSWCEEINENDIPMVLSVDNDNLPAINLYEKYGFTYLEQNDVFRMMIMNVVKG